MLDVNFWRGKKVFVTGHTGFKGSWLVLWLNSMGASVFGYSLPAPTNPNMFELCKLDRDIQSVMGDIRDFEHLLCTIKQIEPEIVFHLAAQPLVLKSYDSPMETYQVNVMGTVNVLECIRNVDSVKAVVNVTTDKCYENQGWYWGYRENDALGGYDPYSNSKACSELITAAYRNSFFSLKNKVALASARAGNVIGGGDWAEDRLIPDCVRALMEGKKVVIRNSDAIRPWQHVLEPLSGYLILAQKLYEEGERYAGAWNFGPDDKDAKTVEWIVRKICTVWGEGAGFEVEKQERKPHEAKYLKLDCSKAKVELNWNPRWTVAQAIEKVVSWIKAYEKGKEMKSYCLKQIMEYMES